MQSTRPHWTRRRFALGVGFGALGFRLKCPAVVPPPSGWPGFYFLIVSDTHLGRSGESAEKQWQRTAADLSQAEGEFVLHLGDVVNQGLVDQYPIYRRIRDTIGKPFHEIPGNHDPLADFEEQLTLRADRSFEHGGVRFVLFNNSRRDSHDGFITEEQIAWLGSEFDAAASSQQLVIVAAHVPIHTNLPPDRAWHVKPAEGQTAFYELVEHHRERVLAVLHGHFHNGIRGWNDHAPLHEVLMPSALYNQRRNLAAAPGYHLDEIRPGFVRASFVDGGLLLRYHIVGTPDEGPTKSLGFEAGEA